MEGTKPGRRIRGGQRVLLPLRGDGQSTGFLATLPSFCYSVPFHPSTDRVLMLAGEVGTPAAVASGNLLPLAAPSLAHRLVPFKPEFGVVAE